MPPIELCFWMCAAWVIYTYVGYPALVAGLGALRRGEPRRARYTGGVSVVLSAHDEEENLRRRLPELIQAIRAAEVPGEIIVISDGSSDDTAEVARSFEADGVRVIEWLDNRGKAA